jgi:biopolymer transport protein ExbD
MAHTRGKARRDARRIQQFQKFKLNYLNLVPLVDTFVSIVFFSLATQVIGDVTPVVQGITLPESRVGASASMQLTVGIGAQITMAGSPVMSAVEAARAQSDNPREPLLIPQLYSVLRSRADSIRGANNVPANNPVLVPLAIQGDRTMRYDLLSRVMQTARLAGFRNINLQVHRPLDGGPGQSAN